MPCKKEQVWIQMPIHDMNNVCLYADIAHTLITKLDALAPVQ